MPPIGGGDPSAAIRFDWTGAFINSNVPLPGFALPQDMIFPLRLWERVTGSAAAFTPMEYTIDGFANQTAIGLRNYQWEWREDGIYVPGASQRMDIRIRYAAYLPDFVANSVTSFANQAVPILRSLTAFAWFIASEFSNPRGDIDGKVFDDKGELAAKQLIDQDAKRAALRSQWTIPDIPAAVGNTPYDSVSTVLNTVRVRMNALAKSAGDVVTASQPFTQQAFNTAWRRMQEFLVNLKFSRLMGIETEILAIPAVGTSDPGVSASLTWSGYSDGKNAIKPAFSLPAGLIRPIRLWERVTGSNAGFTPMEFTQNGLGNQPKQARNYAWEWVGDSLNLPGSTVPMDLRIRYSGSLPDFVGAGATPWYLQQVPIARALDALAWFTCFELASARPDLGLDADTINGLQTNGEKACTQLVAKDQQAQDLRGEQTIPDIPAASGNTPYDTAGTILNVARARLNKAGAATGDIISAQNPFTQQCFNTAYRKLQGFLAGLGYIRLTSETVITALPVVASLDPAVQVSLSWSGFFDGVNYQAMPILPDDLIFPLKIWERQTGTQAVFIDPGMENMLDGLMSGPKLTYNGQWEWREDGIYMPGSTFSMDLRIRYAKYLPDLAQAGPTPWYMQQVPIARCSDTLSLYFCAEVARARPDLELDPIEFMAEADAAAALVFNRDVRAKQRVNVRRRSRSGRLEGGGLDQYGICY